jgi:hypothetical protein
LFRAARFRESAPNAVAARDSGQVSHAQPEAAPPKRNVMSSSLNSASPPFYPSSASTQDFPVAAQTRDIQAGGSNKIPPSSMKMDDNSKLQSGSMVRGRIAMDYGGRDKLLADGPIRSSQGRAPTASLNSGFTSSSVNPGQSPIARASGGNSNIGISSNNQPQSHGSVMHQKLGQVQNQSATRIPTQQLSHRTSNLSPVAQHLPGKSGESGENGSYPTLNDSKTASAVVKANSQETGMSSFMYGGTQVIGAAGLSQGDQNFSGTPALLPGLLSSSFSTPYFSVLIIVFSFLIITSTDPLPISPHVMYCSDAIWESASWWSWSSYCWYGPPWLCSSTADGNGKQRNDMVCSLCLAITSGSVVLACCHFVFDCV